MSILRKHYIMKTYIYIQADMNDADYTAQLSEIQAEHIDTIQVVCNMIKANKHRHNWPTGHIWEDKQKMYPELTDEQEDIFTNYCPYGESGIHSIVDVKILIVNEELNLFNEYDN
jgi:hypothetical protein